MHSILDLFESESNLNLVNILLPSDHDNYSSSSSLSSFSRYAEIESLDNNIIENNKKYPQKTLNKLTSSGLCMEEYHSDEENANETSVDKLIEEINNNSSSNSLLVSSTSLPSSPLPKIASKCMCKVKCKCKCHNLVIASSATSNGNNSNSSSYHGSTNMVASRLSLDWEDVNLDLLVQEEGIVFDLSQKCMILFEILDGIEFY